MPGEKSKRSKKPDELPVKAEIASSSAEWPLSQDAARIFDVNQEVLIRLASLIRMAESFRLGFVKCNQPVQSRQLFARLKDMLAGEAGIVLVDLKGPVESLRRAILQELEQNGAKDQGKKSHTGLWL